jgi:hypothetical protein
MIEKTTQRRRHVDKKHLLNTHNEHANENIPEAAKKRKQHHHNSSHFKQRLTKMKFPIRLSIVFITGLVVLFTLYKFLIGTIYVEYTNIPINLPKLINVNESISERFWGTYR